MKRTVALVFCFSILFNGLNAQPVEKYNSYKEAFPNEDGLILKKKKEILIEAKGDRPSITSKEYEEVLWLSDKALYQRKDAVYYGIFDPILDISAKTFVPEGKSYKEMDVEDFIKTDYIESDIFYDDIKVITFNYPNISSGCRTVKEYTKEIGDPHFLSGFHFNSYFPTIESEVQIIAPSNVKINYKLINCDNFNIEFSQKKKGKNTIYTWKGENLAKVEREPNAPGYKFISPHVIFYIEKYEINGLTVKVFSKTDDLHSWYANLVENVNSNNDEELLQLVDSLTAGKTTGMEKAKSIYYWVQENIKYIAIEYGMGGFRPRPADMVFHRRYGDCKDMANLINYMLNKAGVTSYLTWIGTRDIPYSYNEVPTPAVDNHMIVTCKIDTSYYFLDATGGYLPIDMPSAFIQGKEAMLNVGEDEYDLLQVPALKPSKNMQFDSVVLSIDDDDIIGKGDTKFSGYYDVNFNAFVERADKEDMNMALTGRYQKGSNKYQVTSNEIILSADRSNMSELKYSFKLPDYVIKQDSTMYINLNLDKTYLSRKLEKDRKNDYVFSFKHFLVHKVVLEVPEGYEVQHYPSAVEKDYGNFQFSFNYEVKDNMVVFEHTIGNSLLLLSKDKMDDWNDMINSLQSAYSSYIILKKE